MVISTEHCYCSMKPVMSNSRSTLTSRVVLWCDLET
uniref:Uncharacterized protein n=1 Tax=Anguilla anguilla TaxID=7936 RepID=A0A0E9SAY4_ANGAN